MIAYYTKLFSADLGNTLYPYLSGDYSPEDIFARAMFSSFVSMTRK